MSQLALTCKIGQHPMLYDFTLDFDPGVGEESAIVEHNYKEHLNHFSFPLSLSETNLRTKFSELKSQWESETAHISSITDICMHPAYQQIIGMGKSALPFIIEELALRPTHWFWALKAITGENPIKKDDMGRIDKMAKAWLMWAIRNINI